MRTLAVVTIDLRTFLVGSVLQIFKKLNSIFRSQILINPFSIDLNHRSVGAGSQAFDLLNGEHIIWGGLS